MSLKNMPEECRPREKLLARGPESLTNSELLAIFLRTGVTGMNAIELASYLLEDFGSLRGLMQAELKQFSARKGLGSAKYAQLQAVLELSKRHLGETLAREDALSSPSHTARYLSSKLRDRPREAFLVLYLDNQNRPIKDEILFEGTINSANVYPREVVKRCLDIGANAVILAHNHPSGIAEPSSADRHITNRIGDALALVDIRLLDHMVIGDGDVVSFAERGWI
ncbi:DNA repair protein RadC [Grimontia kaedaensis]|uniref:DNA repair protein RadC n=1 Tax=Grimontia kaedaensis TaxID=2872157 RepID=A0ABY4WSN0_9GAMM|nr:DNA repair protein RadC [Grimontia kaedaensis]USH02588.1 DNA repair protein RadC [Grimontia kaedaensis]